MSCSLSIFTRENDVLLTISPFVTEKMGKIGAIGSFSKKCLGKWAAIGVVDHE